MASTIQKMGTSVTKSRGSKFSGYIVPVSDVEQFKELLSNYRHLNPDACHVCSAYRIHTGNRIDEHSSDDGEPRGTAGLPMLNLLKSDDLVNVAAFVVRIFGGTLLGIPGLIAAYSDSVKQAVDSTVVVPWIKMISIKMSYSHSHNGIVSSIISRSGAFIESQDFTDKVTATVFVPEDNSLEFKEELSNALSGEIEFISSL